MTDAALLVIIASLISAFIASLIGALVGWLLADGLHAFQHRPRQDKDE